MKSDDAHVAKAPKKPKKPVKRAAKKRASNAKPAASKKPAKPKAKPKAKKATPETPKRGPGRPRIHPPKDPNAPKNKGGRPRKAWYEDVFADLGDPPDDPLELAGWCQRLAAKCARETAMGRGNREINQQVRGLIATITRCMPFERLRQAEALIRNAAEPKKPAQRKGQKVVKRDAKPAKKGQLRK